MNNKTLRIEIIMKIKNLVLAAFAVLAVAACSKKEEQPQAAGISVDISSLEFPASVSSKTATVIATRDWNSTITYEGATSEKWISVTPSSGSASSKAQKVEITVLANPGYNRTATIKFSIGLSDVTIPVIQAGDKGEQGALTVTEFNATDPDKTTVYTVTGTASSNYSSSYNYIYISDGTSECEIYQPTNADAWTSLLKKGNIITVKGTHTLYEKSDGTQIHEVTSGEIVAIEEGEGTDYSKAEAVSVADFIKKADNNTYYKLTGTVSGFSATYCSFDLTDESGSIYVYSVDNKDDWSDKIKNGGTVTLAGLYLYYASKSQNEVVDAYILSFEEAQVEKKTFEGLVVAVSSKAFLVKTSDGYAYAYDSDNAPSVKVGDKIKLTGEMDKYNDLDEVVNYTVETISSDNTVEHPSATELDGAAMNSYNTIFGYVKFSGKLTVSGNYYNIEVNGATKTGSLANATGIDASLSGKIVDVEGYFIGLTGSTSNYFNIICTSIKASDDQSGADSGDSGEGDSGDSAASLTPGENEVLYVLTNEEIQKVTFDATASGTNYGTHDIESEGGKWTGNFAVSKTNTFLQFRNNNASYMTSPEYSSKVKRVVLVAPESKYKNSTQFTRTIYAVPVVNPADLPTGKDASGNNISYTSDQWSDSYGSVSLDSKGGAQTVEMSFSADVKQFSLIPNGAVYIDAIYVFCEK